MNRIGMFAAAALVALMIAASTMFIVDQRQVAVIYALGEIKDVITEPGLKFKLPPPFQNVVFLDKRIQTLDNTETRPIFTAEKKSLVIDWLVKWRITEPRQFIRNNGADFRNLENRLGPVVQAAFNEEITRRNVAGVLSVEREKVMQDVRPGWPTTPSPSASRSSTCASSAWTSWPTSPIRCSSAWSPSASAWPTRRARRAWPTARRSAPMPTASERSSLPRPTAMRRRSRARATGWPRRCMPTPSAATRPSPSSTAAWKPIGRASVRAPT